MENSGLSTNLTSGVLAPASSVRAVEGQSARQDTEGNPRRRPRSDREEPDLPVEPGEAEHQLDRLA